MHSAKKIVVLTIGHSNHELSEFINLLQRNGVTAVADVRSQPSSRLPHFSHPAIAGNLKQAGIDYVFLGRELGARRLEPECYEDRQAVYEKIADLPAFREGLARIRRGSVKHRIALMCAEQEPLDCHRTILICRRLRGEAMIRHILPDGAAEDHSQTEQRLVSRMGVHRTLFDPPDLSDADLLERAYEERGRQIAFRADQTEAVA